MKTLRLECQYCGKFFRKDVWSNDDLMHIRCPSCGEGKLLKEHKAAESDKHYYDKNQAEPWPEIKLEEVQKSNQEDLEDQFNRLVSDGGSDF